MTTASPRVLSAYWRDIRTSAPISREEESLLVQRARSGDDTAMQELVSANLRFVVSVAHEFRGTGQPLCELISDGNLGLIEAARRFDETRGFRFISYAVWWIRQTIRRSLMQRRRMVSAPTNRLEDMKVVEETRSLLTHQLGRIPSDMEIAEHLGYTPIRVRRALDVSTPEVRLDAVDGNEGIDLLARIVAHETPADHLVEVQQTHGMLAQCFDILDSREREIIRCHYGFDGAEPMTLEAIGQRLGLTRERIRQLRNGALARIRDRFGSALHEVSQN